MTPEERLAKQRAYDKKYYAEHAEEKRRKAKAWYQAHKDNPEFKEKNRQRVTKWYEANKNDPEVKKSRIESSSKWREEHHDAWLAWRRKHREQRMEDPEFVAQIRAQRKRYREKKFPSYRKAVLEAKKMGCCLCLEKEPVCLDFHHIDPSTKLNQVASLHLFRTMKDLLDEIAKCVVVCANCHRKFHAGLINLPAHITNYTPTKRKNGMIA